MLPTDPKELRKLIRNGKWAGLTGGLAPGYQQTNLVLLPQSMADEFEAYCQLNPKPCPLLARGVAGDVQIPELATDMDIRTDVPLYRVFLQGQPSFDTTDICSYWREDLVPFALGCSLSFESALLNANITLKHYKSHTTCAAYTTSIQTVPSAPFHGELVVSMRGIRREYVQKAVEITEKYPFSHGGPVHIGAPEEIGITNLNDHIDGIGVTELAHDEIPMFWACGVTSQIALINASPDLFITHAPGHMLITDLDALSQRDKS